MQNSSKIIILRGNSESGKTTVANVLQKRLGRGTFVISQDVIRREMLWVRDGSETKAISLLINLVKYGKENCEFVILEGILNAVWYKELFEIIKLEFDSSTYAYYYDLSFEETLKRHQTKLNCNDFGENDMKQWWNDKDFIEIIEEKILSRELSIEETVDIIIKDIKNR
ncbi:kinase [Clostridium sp. YIM B02555]|uniref:kinase n=1 Tax=Clostridium sp. YIM B02555 TaxID=2911968 RepID=UPI001EEE1690|nr:kinase [Clostridium sp. YIM B02555]